MAENPYEPPETKGDGPDPKEWKRELLYALIAGLVVLAASIALVSYCSAIWSNSTW